MLAVVYPRNRSSEQVTPTTGRTTVTTDGIVTSDTISNGAGEFTRASIGDQSNGNWREAQRRGVTVMSPMLLQKSSRSAGGVMDLTCTATWVDSFAKSHTRVTRMVGDHASSGFESSINGLFPIDLERDLESMASVSLTKLLAKLSDADTLVGETMADFDKTVQMFKHPFKGATDLIGRMVKSRNRHLLKSGSNLVQANANSWLEYCYGWKPLLLDAEKIIEYVHEKREPSRKVRVVRAEVKRKVELSSPFSFGSMTDPAWNRQGSASRKVTARACSGIMYSINNCTSQDRLAQLLGSRAIDIPSTLWEVIPFSFVVDWFTNIGTWIRASMPDPLVNIQGKWTTSIYDDKVSVDNCVFTYSEYVTPGVYARASAPMNTPSWTRFWIQRDVNPAISAHPVLTGLSLSVPRSLSAASLAVQQISGRLRSLRH